MLVVNMEKELSMNIYERIHSQFNVTEFKKYFYCLNITYFQLMDLLSEWYQGCKLYFRVDHIVVKQEGQCLQLFLLCSHLSGKCATFLHRWLFKVIHYAVTIHFPRMVVSWAFMFVGRANVEKAVFEYIYCVFKNSDKVLAHGGNFFKVWYEI